jgi:hypothetical protein
MDIKKFKPSDILDFLDGLVAKVPENIATLFRYVMIAIFSFCVFYAIYWGYQRGYASAKEEGQELARDTKSLFTEEIEREYNRKRKNIRMPSADALLGDEIYKQRKQYESYGREGSQKEDVVIPDQKLLEEETGSFRTIKSKSGGSPIIETENQPYEATVPFRAETQKRTEDFPIRSEKKVLDKKKSEHREYKDETIIIPKESTTSLGGVPGTKEENSREELLPPGNENKQKGFQKRKLLPVKE